MHDRRPGAGPAPGPEGAAFTGSCSRRTGAVLAALGLAGVLAAVLLAPAGQPDHRPVTGYLVGALVALASGLVVLLAQRFGLTLRPAVHIPPARVVGSLMVVRGASWLLLAGSALDGRVGVPEPGDAVNPVTGFLAIGAALAAARGLRPHRSRLLVLEILMTTSTTLLALWAVAFSRAADDVAAADLAWCLALVAVFVVQLVTGILVLGAEGVLRTSPTTVALVLITVGDVTGLLTSLSGPRHVPAVALACWCLGWPLLAWRVLTVRTGAAPAPTHLMRLRRQAATSTIVLAVSGLGVLTAILTWVTGMAPAPTGAVAGTLMILSLVSFALHEAFVGADRLQLTEDLAEQALRDPWTGLANRRGLSERIRLVPAGSEWAVLALDLDGFKAVNDVHGHSRGDTVLAEVARVLRANAPPGALTARTGGDEFAMLVPGDVEHGRQIGAAVVAAVPRALEPLALAVPITVSVGVGRLGPGGAAAADPAGTDPLTPLVEASAALRSAKAGGRNRVQVYPGHVARLRERRLRVESRLRDVLGPQPAGPAAGPAEDVAGGVTSVGQPVVDLATRRVVAVEALARWHDAELGTVPPSEFVPVAEETGLVASMGTRVLRSALDGFAAQGLVGSGLTLGVNVSPIELRSPSFAESVAGILAAAAFPPRHLVIEVTEAVLVEEDDPAVRVLGALTDLGVRVAIDDFGTGYSALGYLRRLPVQALKIDRSLLDEARTTMRTRHLLAGLADLAGRIGVAVVVEGVEDEHTARMAEDLGASLGQGHFLGRPMHWAGVADQFRGSATSPT
ncbi:bifunctional diguanylate cyclase/phosphodiesterase [Kineosporia sp. R_H_3]|uniref:putative bifunctional diguanylate cyclase/phosphodiesterase n=1 Tax=Kineosporia sp. R_H_3 TaxID=1961848 RepID=UPI001303FA00|nr:GGDEF domain-containing phosphodiesterase [Kineosporia sp. R_H_3]